MARHELDGIDDPRLEPYRHIRYRNPTWLNPWFIAEGRRVVQRLLASSFQVHSVLASRRRIHLIEDHLRDDIPTFVLDEQLVAQLVGFDFHSGLMACGVRCPIRSITNIDVALHRHSFLVACPNTTLPDNLGSLIRLASVFALDAVIVGPKSVDPFARRVIRVSMGHVFRRPIIQPRDDVAELETLRREHGFEVVAAAIDPAAQPLPLARRRGPMVLLVGNEAFGLPPQYLKLCDRQVMIPMGKTPQGPTGGSEAEEGDSLNVTHAAAILLYHFSGVVD